MPLSFINGKTLLFIHIPKTGGSSVDQYLMDKGEMGFFSKDVLPGMAVTPQHLTWRTLNAMLPRSLWDHAFAVLRDPLDRLASEFRMRLSDANPKLSRSRILKGHLRSKIRGGTPQSVLLGGSAYSVDFNTWVELALEKCKKDPNLHDNHFRPQSEFVGEGCRLFRFEDGLNKVFDWIDEITGTPSIERTHLKKGQSTDLNISDQTRRLVKDFYKDDYALIQKSKVDMVGA